MPDEDKKGSAYVGQRLKICRDEKGFTQKQVAEELGISETHYRSIEKGHNDFSKDLLVRMSILYEKSTDYLLFGKIDSGIHADMVKAINALPEPKRHSANETIRYFLETIKQEESV